MKTKSLFGALLLLVSSQVFAQVNHSKIPLIGEKAPSFTAETTNGTLNFPEDLGRKWKILLSHPADFTPVCSSELLEFGYAQQEFDKLGAKLVVVSTDDMSAHQSWKKSLETISYKGRDPVKISFPLVDDHTKAIAYEYGMIHPYSGTTKDVRGVFIIDPNNVIRAFFFYPATTGRNIEEITRTLEALETSDKEAVLTPANWTPGSDVLLPYVKSADSKDVQNDNNHYQVTWYMNFQKAKTN